MTEENHQPKVPIAILLLGLVVPTVITWIYFVLLGDRDPQIQQLAYGLGKGLQTLVLACASWYWLRPYLRSALLGVGTVTRTQWGLGLALGLLIGVTIFVAYRYLLVPAGVMDLVKSEGSKKLEAFGGKSPMILVGVGVFYSLIHSGFEEIYWRGFIHRGFRDWCSLPLALSISGIGFMSHHILVLGKFFGYCSVWMYVCAAGVLIGGLIWGWMVERTKSLLPGWLSHGLVDAAIFAVGYHLVFILE